MVGEVWAGWKCHGTATHRNSPSENGQMHWLTQQKIHENTVTIYAAHRTYHMHASQATTGTCECSSCLALLSSPKLCKTRHLLSCNPGTPVPGSAAGLPWQRPKTTTVEMKRLPPPNIRFYLTRLAASPHTLVIWHECCRFLMPLLLFVAVTLPGFDALSNSQNCQVCQVDL